MSSITHVAFEWLRSETIDSLNITIEEYRHRVTGAQHIHISADNTENVFLVALRTVPEDSSGVAHILEHTALCGSKKYPVRDPFFMMIRRSLNTFMNAFTSSDWTAYPFASQNRKDFNNLLDVYLDAVFFSRLDPLDFAQEGHRVEFEDSNNSDGELVYKGVVYNEMKGAMSSVPSQLWQTLSKHLYPTTTYHHNSGGEPANIPDLSYQQLLDFYRSHYHPSNAIFMTFGDIPASNHQEKFEQQVMHHFKPLDKKIEVEPEQRFSSPISVTESYPLDEEDSNAKTHIVMAWLLGKATDLDSALRAQLLSSLLFDNSASPLQHALETTNLGSAPSPLCGLDDSQYEMSFCCGIEGSEAESAQALQDEVLAVLQAVAEDGLPQEQIEASLHQLELQQREIGGDSYPYGLQLILTALTAATHRGDVLALLNLEPALEKLRNDIQQPGFIQQLVKDLLLDNPHRVLLTMAPDQDLPQQLLAAEKQRLAQMKQAMSDDDKQNVIDQAQALIERQEQVDDDTILPKVSLEDIPANNKYIVPGRHRLNEIDLSVCEAGTNGLVYQQIVIKMPQLSNELLSLLPYYCMALTELGVGQRDYMANQQLQAQLAGSLTAFSSMRGSIDSNQDVDGYISLSAKGLCSNQAQLCQLMLETLEQVRFDELQRLTELVAQGRARLEQSVTGNGHSLAMTAASAGLSPSAALSHRLSGLEGIRFIKSLDDKLSADPAEQQHFAQQLQQIHQLVLTSERQYLLVSDPDSITEMQSNIAKAWPQQQASGATPIQLEPINQINNQAWITNTQVNFCAKAYATVSSNHSDAAALTVLGGFLRNGYLHRAIREQGGAYGGGASQDNNIGAFRFYSYRDPRMSDTLKDFDAALEWLAKHQHTPQSLEEAILGVVSAIDKPSSPAGEAKQSFYAELHGRTPEVREAFRQRILTVTIADLQRVAATYLIESNANTALVCPAENQTEAEALGLSIEHL